MSSSPHTDVDQQAELACTHLLVNNVTTRNSNSRGTDRILLHDSLITTFPEHG